MPKAIDLTEEKRFVGMFVGPKHSGKTVAAASFPSPLEDLDFDGRIRGILGAPWIKKEGISYDFFPPKDPDMINKINKKLDSYLLASTNPGMGLVLPSTLVLDSLTAECLAVIQQSLMMTHTLGAKGKYVGNVPMVGPEDYGVEANVTYQIMAFLRSVAIPNVIVTAHVVDKYGKANPDDPFSESIITGEKLSVRDKIGENVKIYFDHIFRFDRKMVGGKERFTVKFRSDIACTSYEKLPPGEIDITGKDFYNEVLMPYLKPKV